MGALSKGCESCKRRKVKCDETYPQCTRCCKAGIKCTGFTPQLKFVDEEPRIRRSMAVSHAQFHEFFTIKRSSHLAFHSSRIRCSRPPSAAPLLANSLPLTAFKDDIFISYLLFKLFERDRRYALNAATEPQCGIPTDWIPQLVKTTQRPRQKSWDALAAIVFGQAHNSHDVITSALRLYGQALSELRNKLSNPDDRSTDSTLASMTALYMYEILMSKTEKGWMLHAGGLGWLLEWRGPRQQKSFAGKSIFLEHRIMIVTKSIISRQSTFLRSPIWKTVPWEDNPASKSTIDYLIDIGTDITEYIAQIKRYDNSKSDQEFEYSQLRTQVANSLEELNAWWRQWESHHTQPATEVTSHQLTGEPLFPTLLEYDMPWTAFTVCNYNAMRILLLQLWHMLQLIPGSTQTTDRGVVLDMPNPTALLGITSNIKGLAYEILRALKYAYGKCRRFIFTSSFLFLQDTAYGCFDQNSKEAVWVARHGWAELADSNNIEDENLLKRLLPLGQIRAGDVSVNMSSKASRVL